MKNLIIYVIHYTPLKERKTFLLNELNKHSLNYYFIEDYDREKLSNNDLKIFDTNKEKKVSLFGYTNKNNYSYESKVKFLDTSLNYSVSDEIEVFQKKKI